MLKWLQQEDQICIGLICHPSFPSSPSTSPQPSLISFPLFSSPHLVISFLASSAFCDFAIGPFRTKALNNIRGVTIYAVPTARACVHFTSLARGPPSLSDSVFCLWFITGLHFPIFTILLLKLSWVETLDNIFQVLVGLGEQWNLNSCALNVIVPDWFAIDKHCSKSVENAK